MVFDTFITTMPKYYRIILSALHYANEIYYKRCRLISITRLRMYLILLPLLSTITAYDVLYTNPIPLSLCSMNSAVGFKYNRAVAWTLFAEPTLKAGIWPIFTEWEAGSQYITHETSDLMSISCQPDLGKTIQIQGIFPFAVSDNVKFEDLSQWRLLWQEGKVSPILNEDHYAPQLLCVTDDKQLQCMEAFNFSELFKGSPFV